MSNRPIAPATPTATTPRTRATVGLAVLWVGLSRWSVLLG